MPSTRSLALAVGAAVLAGLQGVAVAQPTGAAGDGGFLAGVGIRLVAGLVVYLLLGGGLVALAPGYAEETVAEIRDDPGSAFGWGLVVGILVPIALGILAVTIIGLVVAIPGFVVLFFLGLVGNAVTVAWVGTWLGDRRPGGEEALIGAVVMAVVGAVPVLGSFVTTVVGFFGLGVVSRRLYEDRRGDGGSGRDRTGSGRESPEPAGTASGRRHDDL